MNSKEKDIYLELLRASLWEHGVDTSIFTEEWNWKTIIDSYIKNDLLGIVANTIIKLPESLKPQMQEMILVYSYLGNLLKSHTTLNRRLADIMPRLEKAGCQPVLFKGQGLSSLYPKNCIRSCGDLDIFIGSEGIDNAKKVVNAMADKEELQEAAEHSFHYHIELKGIVYELHQAPGESANCKYSDNFKTLSKKYLQPHHCENVTLPITNDEDITVNVPLIEFNVWYVFNHLMEHFSEGGVGYRLLIDWMMVIREWNNRSVEGNKLQVLEDSLRKIGLLRAWKIMGGILVYQLGLPKEDFPLFDAKMAKKSQGYVKDEIIEGSRFGFGSSDKLDELSHGSRGKLYRLRYCHYAFRPTFVISPWAPYINSLKYMKDIICFNLPSRKRV